MNLPAVDSGTLSFLDPTADIISKCSQLVFRDEVMSSAYTGVRPLLDPGHGITMNQTVLARQTVHATALI